jgi:hypothetical protein
MDERRRVDAPVTDPNKPDGSPRIAPFQNH